MAAKKPAKSVAVVRPAPREPMSADAKARVRKFALHTLALLAFCGFWAGALVVSQKYVSRITQNTSTPPTVVLVDRPAWMTDTLADQIAQTLRPLVATKADDHQLLVDRAELLQANPWVKHVIALRRAYHAAPGDVIEVSADYRVPVALVRWQDAYWYVDNEGVRLPEKLTAQQVATLILPGKSPNFRVIDGVALAPASAGKPWPGADVRAGIELIALLADKSYADQIVKVDVTNYAGRVNPNESQLNLVTRYGTQVRWGQAPSTKAFFVEQPINRKLDVLEQARTQTGRVDMNQPWIDLRFDSTTMPDKRASVDAGR